MEQQKILIQENGSASKIPTKMHIFFLFNLRVLSEKQDCYCVFTYRRIITLKKKFEAAEFTTIIISFKYEKCIEWYLSKYIQMTITVWFRLEIIGRSLR